MRCFIAISLPDALKKQLHHLISSIATSALKIPPAENLHLTIKFLSEITPSTLTAVCNSLEAVCKNHSPFTLSISGTGVFASIQRASVFWVGLETSQELTALYEDVENALSVIGFDREKRPFAPHITVARAKDHLQARATALRWTKDYSSLSASFDVKALTVYESILRPSHAIYKVVKTIDF